MSQFDVLPKQGNSAISPGEVPFEVVPLPSAGKLYPEDHPYHNETHVEIKAMTALDEDILTSKALLKKGTVFGALVRSCLVNKAVEPSTLLLGDKSAILLSIRISGFGSEYKVQTQCPECGDDFVHSFDLSKVTIKPLQKEPIKVGLNLFEYKLPKSGKVVQFSLLTDGDELDMIKTNENKKKAGLSTVEASVTDRLIKSIKKIDNIEDPAQIIKMVRSMSAFDSKSLRTHIRSIEPDVLFEQSVECPSCGTAENHIIPMGNEFFWPKWD